MKRFITTAIYRVFANGTQKSISCNGNDTRGYQTSRDYRTRTTVERSQGETQETVSCRPSEGRLVSIRKRVRQSQGYFLQGQWCSKGTKERWTTLTSPIFFYFSQYLPLLSSTTIDDYILLDKVSIIVQCYSSQSVQVCARGLGL